jgi:hypothetical protein
MILADITEAELMNRKKCLEQKKRCRSRQESVAERCSSKVDVKGVQARKT